MPPERDATTFMVHIEPLFIQLVLTGGASNMVSIQLKLVWPVLCPMPPWEYAAFQCRGQTQAEIPSQMEDDPTTPLVLATTIAARRLANPKKPN